MSGVLQDKELQAYYDALFETFRSPGWKFLMEDVAKIKAASEPMLRSARELHSMGFVQGELNFMDWLLTVADRTNDAFDAMVAEEQPRDDE